MAHWRVSCCRALAAVVLVGTIAGGHDAGATEPPSSIDLARADRAVVADRLAELDRQRHAAQEALDTANAAVDAASRDLAAAEANEAASRTVTEARDAEVRAAAVDAYVSDDPTAGGLAGLLGGDAQTFVDRSAFLAARTAKRNDVLHAQRVAQEQLAAASAATRDRAAEASAAATAAEGQLRAVEASRADAAALVATLDRRVEAALAEAAALADLDPSAATQLVSDESALRDAAQRQAARTAPRARSRSSRSAPTTTTPRPRTPTTAPRTTTTRPRPTTTVRGRATTTAPPTTRAPTPPSSTSSTVPVSYVPPPAPATTVVGGIRVNVAIAEPLRAMLAAAAANGVVLGGVGYRDPAIQIELRRQHCGPTDFDIWQKPASQCVPPTARPGQSLHEQGLAIDLTCAGHLITTRADPCFVWLAANAATYGFANLPSEPWHWSTTGN